MATVTVPLSLTGTITACGPCPPPNGPAHIAVAPSGNGKTGNLDLIRLAIGDTLGFAPGDAVSIEYTPSSVTVTKV